MATKLYFNPFVPAYSNIGVPIAEAKLYFYYTETTTLAPVYSDSAMLVPLTNPVVANLAGKYPDIYLDAGIVYRVYQTDKDDNPTGDAVDPYIPGTAIGGGGGSSGGGSGVGLNIMDYGAYGDGASHPISSDDIASNPQWLGTYLVGTEWDTVAAQEWIYAALAGKASTPGSVVWNLANTTSNHAMWAPVGNYLINKTLLLVGQGFTMTFEARLSTRFTWIGPNDSPLFNMDSPAYASFYNVTVSCTTAMIEGTAIWEIDGTGTYGGLKPQQISLYDIVVIGNRKAETGVRIAREGSSAQGDTITFINPYIGGCERAGISLGRDGIGAQNALSVYVIDGDIQNCLQDGIFCFGGSIYVDGTSFQSQSQGLTFTPTLSQILQYGADVKVGFGAGQTVACSVKNIRSEGEIASYADATPVFAENVTTAAASHYPFYANYPYDLGTSVFAGGRSVLVVDSDGMKDWKHMDSTLSTQLSFVDPTATYTTNQWAGFRFFYRYPTGFTEHKVINSNTATTIDITGETPVFSPVSPPKLYRIGGATDTEPDWTTMTRNTGITNGGFYTTAGSATINVSLSIAAAIAALGGTRYVVIPYAYKVDPGELDYKIFRAPLIAKVVSVNAGTGVVVLDTKAQATLSNVSGWYGKGIKSGQITFMDIVWSPCQDLVSVTDSYFTMGANVSLYRITELVRTTFAQFTARMSKHVDTIYTALAAALTPGTTVAIPVPTVGNTFKLTPGQNSTLTIGVPDSGTSGELNLVVTTSGTTSYTLTFGTGFKPNGTLSTGTVSGKKFLLSFVFDGVEWIEKSRTGAL